MILGVPKEIKDKEFRVAIVPDGVRKLTDSGHTVLIEAEAGVGSGIADLEFQAAGAEIIHNAATVYAESDLIMKVKEPLAQEYQYMREGLVLFTFLHLAPLPELTRVLLDKKVSAVAYETVSQNDGYLPILAPMSAVAGRMSVQVGAHFLEKEAGGRGVLLGGVEGVEPGRVVILGSGTVGTNAAQMAVGLGASVTVMCRNPACQVKFEKSFEEKMHTRLVSKENICDEISRADLVIGAVLVTGAAAPKLITRDMLSLMQKGSIIVDVSIDQGGCVETARPTTHSDPVYEVDGIIHYCVANMPGAVPRTSTFALTYVTLPYALAIADNGFLEAVKKDPALKRGANTHNGFLTNKEVAQAQERDFTDLDEVLN
ncbi:alanine dehydrogenase [Thermodesulfobacteriota bacterium]